ncbi:MAG TPA: glycosyltransferase family 39 protein [Planctomycetaceae bacterium]|nr:glycosyltransferase family 39 protein [Planctomycetaceae bacterium]
MTAKRSHRKLSPPRSGVRVLLAADGRESLVTTVLGLLWLVGFCIFFYSFGLPNNEPLSRAAIWIELPDLLPLSEMFSAPWRNLAQRADIAGVAALMLAGSWALGQGALRLLRPPIDRHTAEHAFFGMALGLSATSLLTLACGVAGLLNRWLFVTLFAAAIVGEGFLRLGERRFDERGRLAATEPASATEPDAAPRVPLFWVALAVVAPFLFVMWLGSMSPDTDFDVRAYHFEGPKEYFQNGRITFLPHNVYTNFPFLTEMFALLGMVLRGDWYWGALAGKCALFALAPLTALGLYAAGRRWFGPTAGIMAALVYLTTPWIDRITIIAYAEGGLTFYLFAALFAVMLAIERMRAGALDVRQVMLAGLLAGSGMACKYTGALQVVAPLGAALVVAAWFALPRGAGLPPGENQPVGGLPRLRAVSTTVLAFGLGTAIAIGPWLVKNLAFTGNPVYPLGYSIFGGVDWNQALDAKFRAAHSPHHTRTFFQYVVDVVANNDWSSPLWYGFAPLALLVRRGRPLVLGLWLFAEYLFVTWWGFTHTIDRFWVPMIPVVCLLAGIGAAWRETPLWRYGSLAVVGLAVWFNLALVAGTGQVAGRVVSDISGFNSFLTDLSRARQGVEQLDISYINQSLPKNSKVLCVGVGEVFESRVPVVYNTVFNPSIFQEWCAAPSAGTDEGELSLKPAAEILRKLHGEKVTHVLVNWEWIRHYREPGNYGYTDFVRPSRFAELVRAGVLDPPTSLGRMSAQGLSRRAFDELRAAPPTLRQTREGPVIVTGLFDEISEGDRQTLNAWAPSLLTQFDGHDVLINAQIFRVR